MGDDKGQGSNIIIGPWESKTPKGGKNRDQIIKEEMDAIDELSQKAMIKLIEVLKEKDFYRHIGFMNETLKAKLFKEMGYEHPLSDLVNHIIIPSMSKDKGDIYTKFRADVVAELVEYLEEDFAEE